MNKIFLVGAMTLYSLTTFSQTVHPISVDCFGSQTSLTIQSGDILQFIHDGCSGNQQFQVDIDGNSVVGSPFNTLVNDTIYETSPIIFDISIGVYALGDMSLWKIIDVTIDNSVGISEVKNINYSIYPNPTTDILNISGQNIESVKVYNMTGQLIISDIITQSQIKLDVSTLKNGIYLVLINDQKLFRFNKQ